MLTLLIMLLVVCVVIWAARAIMAACGLGEPLSTIVYVFIVLIALVYLLSASGFSTGSLNLR